MSNKSSFNEWLAELEEELTVSESKSLNEESQLNMLTFGISSAEHSVAEIESFIIKCRDLYAQNNFGTAKIFYCWLDEMAGHIRTSAVSKSHGRLPFRTQIAECTSIDLANFIKCLDSGNFSDGNLKVWQSGI